MKSISRYIFYLLLHQSLCYSLLMSTHNIHFCDEIKKILILFGKKKRTSYTKKKKKKKIILALQAPITTAADDIFYFSYKISFDIPCELSARQTVHMKFQDLLSADLFSRLTFFWWFTWNVKTFLWILKKNNRKSSASDFTWCLKDMLFIKIYVSSWNT